MELHLCALKFVIQRYNSVAFENAKRLYDGIDDRLKYAKYEMIYYVFCRFNRFNTKYIANALSLIENKYLSTLVI